MNISINMHLIDVNDFNEDYKKDFEYDIKEDMRELLLLQGIDYFDVEFEFYYNVGFEHKD